MVGCAPLSLHWKKEHPIVGGACCAAGHRHVERKRKVALHEATSENGYDDTDRWVSTCDGETNDDDVVNNGNGTTCDENVDDIGGSNSEEGSSRKQSTKICSKRNGGSCGCGGGGGNVGGGNVDFFVIPS